MNLKLRQLTHTHTPNKLWKNKRVCNRERWIHHYYFFTNYILVFTSKAFNIHVLFFVMSILSILLVPLQLSRTAKHTNKAILNSSRPDKNKCGHDLPVDKIILTVLIVLQFLIFCADSCFQIVLKTHTQTHTQSDFEIYVSIY